MSPASSNSDNEETELRFNLKRRPGRPVPIPPGSGASHAHEHERPDGSTIVILRDSRGKIMRGSPLHSLRENPVGREPRTSASVARAALGLPSAPAERNLRRKERTR